MIKVLSDFLSIAQSSLDLNCQMGVGFHDCIVLVDLLKIARVTEGGGDYFVKTLRETE